MSTHERALLASKTTKLFFSDSRYDPEKPLQKTPEGLSEKAWLKIKISVIEYLYRHKSLRATARHFGLSHETLRRNVPRVIDFIRQNSSREMRERYPVESLSGKKTWVDIEKKPTEKPKEGWKFIFLSLRDTLHLTQREVKERMSIAPYEFMAHNSKGEDPLFLSIPQIAPDKYRFARRFTPLFVKSLARGGVHVETRVRGTRKIAAHFVFSGQRELAKITLDHDSSLERFRIKEDTGHAA